MSEERNHWAENALSEFAEDYIKEHKRKRRWGIFFKTIFATLMILTLLSLLTARGDKRTNKLKPHAALIDIRGPIFDMAQANADNIARSLHKAYKNPNTKGIILRINSPGGSPVQADYIFNEITRQKKLHPKIKVTAVCTDICASAAYYIAAAADELYANQASLIGSIGVIFNGFGFVNTMDKLGIERRVITSVKNKAFMDPFLPSNPEQEAHLKTILNQVHQRFENQVKAGRGDRLARLNKDLYSGLVWDGVEAKKLGLIDDFASAGSIARDILETDTVVDYTDKATYFERLAKQLGSSFAQSLGMQLGQSNTLR